MAKPDSQELNLPAGRFACICERAIQDAEDKTWSIIRVIDRVTYSLDEQPPPEIASILREGGVPFKATFFAYLQQFKFETPVEIIIEFETPDHERRIVARLTANPGGAVLGLNVVAPFTIPVFESGLHYFICRIVDIDVVRVPIDVNVVLPNAPAPAAE